MTPYKQHVKAFSWTMMQLGKGKYLLYFIPGLLIGLFFWDLETWAEVAANDSYAKDVPWIGDYLNEGIKWTFSFLGTIFHQFFVFFVLTLLSPLNTFLSEKVDEDLTGYAQGFDLVRFVTEIVRMIGVVIVALSLEFLLMGAYALFSWIFNLDILDPFVYFIIAAYFYGFSFYDYSMERRGLGLGSSLRFSKQNPISTILTGSLFSLFAALPIFGLPIGAVLTTIIATHVFLNVAESNQRK